jgi:hypothetical protein
MKTLVLADINHFTVKLVTPDGVAARQFQNEDQVLTEVSKLMNAGFKVISSSGGRVMLEKGAEKHFLLNDYMTDDDSQNVPL